MPVDDGAADHLPGRELPPLTFPATTDERVDLREAAAGTLVLYLYPRTGRPGVDPPPGWDAIPGARGCTPQSCGFRDRHDELARLGARVAGLSAQTTDEVFYPVFPPDANAGEVAAWLSSAPSTAPATSS